MSVMNRLSGSAPLEGCCPRSPVIPHAGDARTSLRQPAQALTERLLDETEMQGQALDDLRPLMIEWQRWMAAANGTPGLQRIERRRQIGNLPHPDDRRSNRVPRDPTSGTKAKARGARRAGLAVLKLPRPRSRTRGRATFRLHDLALRMAAIHRRARILLHAFHPAAPGRHGIVRRASGGISER